MSRWRDDDITRLAVAIAAALRPSAPADPGNWLEQATHRRIAVHTTKGESFEGILRETHRDGLLLWGVETTIRGTDGKPKTLKLEGEVFIPREQVHSVQTLRM